MTAGSAVRSPRDRSASWTVAPLIAVVILLAVHAILAWQMRIPALATTGDDGYYVALARAVRAWSYVELWTVGTPMQAMLPPGFPAALALLGVTGPDAIAIGVAFNVAMSVAALVCTAVLAGRFSPWLAVAAVAICAVNPLLLTMAARLQSEPLYTALAMLVIVAASRTEVGSRALAVAAAAAVMAALTRSIGVALLVALAAELVMTRRWRVLVPFVVFASVTVGSWFAWTVVAPRGGPGASYIADALYVPAPSVAIPSTAPQVSGTPTLAQTPNPPASTSSAFPLVLIHRLRDNVPAYVAGHVLSALAVPTIPGTRADNVFWLLLVLGAGAAGLMALWQRARVVAGYCVAYAAVLLVWPYALERFVAPALPLIVVAMLVGIWWIGDRRDSLRASRIAAGAIAVTVSLLTISAARWDVDRLSATAACDRRADGLRSPTCASEKQRDFIAALDTVRAIGDANAPVLSAKAGAAYLLTGRQTVRQADALTERDPSRFVAWLRAQHVDVIVLSHLHYAQWGLSPMLSARCADFDLVAAYPSHAAVLRLPPSGVATRDPARGRAACEAILAWARIDWDRDVDRGPLGIW
jgi:hypothetical protein